MGDEIIEEVWRIKDALGAKYNHDLRALAEAMRQRELAARRPIVDLSTHRKSGPTPPNR